MSNEVDIPETLAELEPEEFAFIEFHAAQLINNGVQITKEFVQQLYAKLKDEKFDSGSSFQLMEDPGEKCYRLQALKTIAPKSDVFLIDHAYSFRYRDLRNTLLNKEELRNRLKSMTKFFATKSSLRDALYRPKHAIDPTKHAEFDGDESIVDPRKVTADWANLETLSFCNCGIEEADHVAEMLEWCPNLKALWLNGCPVIDTSMKQKFMYIYVEEKCPTIQIINSQFTKNSKEWAIKFATFGADSQLGLDIPIEEMKECDISGRNFYALKDDHSIFDRMHSVSLLKAYETVFDSFGEADRFIQMIRDMKKLEKLEMDYYLLELFWGIKDRIKKLNPKIRYINDYDLGYAMPKELDQEVDFIIRNIWKITQSYKLVQGENIDSEPVYYVLDEVGSALTHDSEPNCLCFPFIFFKENSPQTQGKTFNLLYPIKQLEEGEFASVDFLRNCTPEQRNCRLGIWTDVEADPMIQKYIEYKKEMEAREKPGLELVEKILSENKSDQAKASFQKDEPLKLYTDFEVVRKAIKDPRYKIVETVEEADALFIVNNLKHYKDLYGDKLKPELIINQFPYEAAFTSKKFLNETVKKYLGTPKFLAETFDLNNEIELFVGSYLYRKSFNHDNYWITKPTTMTKSVDMTVTNNLDLLLRISETGPKIASKYVENPLRYRGVKFDLRQYVVVQIYFHDDFLVRAASNDFTMDKRRLFQNETHFIYNPLKQKMNQQFESKDLIAQFPKKFSSEWAPIQAKIHSLIKTVFALSLDSHPGLAENNACAVYGIDVILDAELEPTLMEVNFSPDLASLAETNEDFVQEILNCMYFGDQKNVTRVF